MSILLHFSLRGLQSDSVEDLAAITRFGLQPILAVLEYAPNLKIALSANGAWLEHVSKKDLSLLSQLVAQKRIEILLSDFVSPALRWKGKDSSTDQLQFSKNAWSALGFDSFAGVWLEAPPAETEFEKIAAQFPGLFIFGTSVDEADSDEFLFAKASAANNSLIGISRLEPADFLKRSEKNNGFIIRSINPPILTVEVRGQGLFSEKLSPSQQRGHLLDLLKDLRGDFAKLCSLPSELLQEGLAKELREFPHFHSPLETAAEPGGSDSELALRVDELEHELDKIPDAITTKGNEEKNLERYTLAKRELAFAKAAELWQPGALLTHACRKAVYENILKAQVEIDSILRAEVDPAIGWIEPHNPPEGSPRTAEIIVDSQLMRLYFSPARGGALTEFDYKPRKFNLTGAFHPTEDATPFIDGLLQLKLASVSPAKLSEINRQLSSQDTAESLVTRKTKDLFGLRLSRELKLGAQQFTWVKHFTVKAGIGAHLNNATTGMSVEYWVESASEPPNDTWALSRFAFTLPSGNPSGCSLRALTTAGGTSTHTLPLTEPLFLRNEDIEGGLCGARLIDGITNFVIDLRSAKPLNAVGIIPLLFPHGESDKQECGGFVVLFFVEARRVFQDDKANTIFLSIY